VSDTETGMLCEQSSVDKMKQAIIHLQADGALATKLTENAEVFVRENCSEENYVFHFNGFIKRTCSDGK